MVILKQKLQCNVILKMIKINFMFAVLVYRAAQFGQTFVILYHIYYISICLNNSNYYYYYYNNNTKSWGKKLLNKNKTRNLTIGVIHCKIKTIF